MAGPNRSGRRGVLKGLVAAGGAVALAGKVAAAGTKLARVWDRETDVICVGTGAAGLNAAISAAAQGARVIVLEKMSVLGGTTAKSGGAPWIPNNKYLRAAGLVDPREDCLRYMCRYSYPEIYDSTSPTLGLPQLQYRLLEAFYDNASAAVDQLEALDVIKYQMFMLFHVNKMAPDYGSDFVENKTPRGRGLLPKLPQTGDRGTAFGSSMLGGGAVLINAMVSWLKSREVPILLEHRVVELLRDGRHVIGVEVDTPAGKVSIKATRGIVFGTGGFAHNRELLAIHQPIVLGSCARPSSTGDIVAMAGSIGARIGPLNTAWSCDVVAEEAAETPAVGIGLFLVPGDSMIFVNRYGRRVVNEKRDYNDRGRVHAAYDSTYCEFPNKLLFMLFDARTLDTFAGSFPLPVDRREVSYIIEGNNHGQLATAIHQRLASLAAKTGGVQLAPGFAKALAESVARYNNFARAGEDLDFHRGETENERDFHLLSSTPRKGTRFAPNDMPNITMYPIDGGGPLYAIILGLGALETNGGPVINEHAQILDFEGNPIPGLFGAGNCIAGPTRGAYYGSGGTIGPALTFGYIAGRRAAETANRS
jgi:3-oxosteroid 1-dehydrogenase